MSRRRLVALVAASVMLLIGILVAGAVLVVTRTDFGRDRVRAMVGGYLARALGPRGHLYLGHLGGGFFTGITIDSLELRDAEDSLFIATGPVRIDYDPRDLVDRRILLSRLELTRPNIYLRRHADHSWNYQRIFPPSGTPSRRTSELRFGDYIVADSVIIRDGTFTLTENWSPADSLRGARRDSAVRQALASPDHEIRRTAEGLKQTRRWTHLELRSPFVRIADPAVPGRLVQVGRMGVDETDPPFRVRNMRGVVRIAGDSVWLALTHFDLPGSTGRAAGKVWWGGDDPIRYDVRVAGDSVSLADVHWVYPTLPLAGGGSLDVHIHNERDLHVLDYALSDLDVRSTRSRLRGAMTFAVGGPVLAVKDVALEADPLDFDLLRTLAGGPFPVDWQGSFTGSVRGRGGPLNRFQLDASRITFRDRHVPGATSTFSAHGGLDILQPSRATFRGLDVTVDRLDLRTPEFLFPSFPRLHGIATGRARLDSIWTDLRFSGADVTLADGAAPPSRFTGSGRVTYGEAMRFDVDLQAAPLSLTAMAQSYPALRARGSYTGPLRLAGTTADMQLTGTLTGPGGTLSTTGRFDFAAPGYGATATGTVAGLDLRALLADSTYAVTHLNGSWRSDVHGDSLATLAGTLDLALDRSRADSVRIFPSVASLAFADGHMRVDSLRLETSAVTLTARGALGLTPISSDTLHYTLLVDTLGGLRPYLRPPRSTRGAKQLVSEGAVSGETPEDLTAALADSLGGRLTSEGTLVGNVDTLTAAGTLQGEELFSGGNLARTLSGRYLFRGLPHAAAGSAAVELDSLLAGGVRLAGVTASLQLHDPSSGTLALAARSDLVGSEWLGNVQLSFARRADALDVTVDSAAIRFGDHSWALERPAQVVSDSTGTTVDTLILHDGGGRTAMVQGRFPVHGPLAATLSMDSLPLADVGRLAQTEAPLDGVGTLTATLSGVREQPRLDFSGRFTDARYGDFHLPAFTIAGRYADRRLGTTLELYRESKPVTSATLSIPIDLALAAVPQRLLDDTLSGRILADSVDLGILQTISPQVRHAVGTASADIHIGGAWRHPTLTGRFLIHDGAMQLARLGTQWRNVDADILFQPDSIHITQLRAASGSQPGSLLSLSGSILVPNLRESRDFGFDLTMHATGFEALNRAPVASLVVSGNVTLTGSLSRPIMSGTVAVDRATFLISDISQKQVVNLNDPEFFNIVDTSLVTNQGLLESLPPALETALENLRVPSLELRVGDDVWLRSQEANIKLAGSVDLTKLGNQRLESGTLRVSRGTYRLPLGIVQRTFQVDSGFVTFYGDPNIPAELNVWASYTVRQANRENGQDVTIVAHLGGTLAQPRLELTSNERIPLSNTEILSYLLVGQPTFASGNDPASTDALRSAAAALLPSVGAVLERALTDQIRFIDYVQVQTGSTGSQDLFTNTGATNVLSGTRIGLGKQIGERTFITANAGLCQLTGAQAGTSFASSLGLTIEHQLDHLYSLQASVEPSSAALQCRPGLSSIGSRPSQYGFDLFREWSF